MISVTAHAKSAIGNPGDTLPIGVAITTPMTTIIRLSTWNVVITGFDFTKPKAALKISTNAAFWKTITATRV